ncbi:MAG TPA: dephospho-CoA kinase [Steroidobacteraceae bacterium]|nr:dephospho-CoA kinase [Steroidobacteraceae bacterium]
MGRRLLIGLTGGIASGKSTVAQRFMDLGVPVIDADVAAREVVAPGKPGLQQVIDRFGSRVVGENGELDRRALREIIFSDPDARRDLEAILHPLIRAEMDRRAAVAVGPYIVMAIPLLIEGGSRDRVDRILVVDVDEAVQLQRVMARDHCSAEQAQAILASQAPRTARLAAADDVLPNGGTVTELRQAVDALHQQYLRLAAAGHPDGD